MCQHSYGSSSQEYQDVLGRQILCHWGIRGCHRYDVDVHPNYVIIYIHTCMHAYIHTSHPHFMAGLSRTSSNWDAHPTAVIRFELPAKGQMFGVTHVFIHVDRISDCLL